MSQSSATGTQVEFGATEFLKVAKAYKDSKRIIDAASTHDSLEDAVAALTDAWEALENQAENGTGYTPDQAMGFGSNSAAVIAESLLGRRPTVGAIRKAFAGLGS